VGAECGDDLIHREKFQVAYVGDQADDHTMDVEALGPALMAFGKLIRAANAELNGGHASVKVVVASEFEHKCFSINFELIQTILKEISDFLGDADRIENAKDLLKKIGVIVGAPGVVIGSVFAYLKWKKGRKAISIEHSHGNVIVNVGGKNNNVHVDAEVFRLAENRQVLEAIEGVLKPIKDRRETKAIEFRENDRAVDVLEKKEVEDIVASCEEILTEEVTEEVLVEVEDKPKVVTATLHIYSPVFDAKAPNWRFLFKRKPIYADIRETHIARDAIKRGGSFTNDRYKVRMEETYPHGADGAPHYKIIEVLEFTPADRQLPLPLERPKKKRTAKRVAGAK